MKLVFQTLRRTAQFRSRSHAHHVNLRPEACKELRIELYGQANPIHDEAVADLCAELNATASHHPRNGIAPELRPGEVNPSPCG